jgi:hypothetical protein
MMGYDICAHMKTTIEIADSLLDEARALADRRGVTLRTLVEEGLRHVVKAGVRRSSFRLRDASFAGDGIDPALANAAWDRLRDAGYSRRGA